MSDNTVKIANSDRDKTRFIYTNGRRPVCKQCVTYVVRDYGYIITQSTKNNTVKIANSDRDKTRFIYTNSRRPVGNQWCTLYHV